MSPHCYTRRQSTESTEAGFHLVIGADTWCMFVQLLELFDEADLPLFVDRRFSGDPLRLHYGILHIVKARCWSVYLRDFVIVALID